MTERLNWTELNVLKQESKVLILLCFFLLPSFLSTPFPLFAFFSFSPQQIATKLTDYII